MRVPIMLVALAATPLLAAAAQSRAAAIQDAGRCQVADANRYATAGSTDRPADPFGRTRTGCAPVTPVPDPPPPPPQPAGTGSITGNLYNDVTGAPLAGWVVTLSGTMSGTTVTDAAGAYLFSGIPGGTYTICEQLLDGWSQAYPTSGPSCTTGYGLSFTLADGQSASYENFWNVMH
jgi:hypothetical protein